MESQKKNKAIFLDRDGVIIQERGEYNYKLKHIHFNEGIIEFVETARRKGYKIIVITNQGGIAKKIYTKEHVKEIHKTMLEFFNSYHLKIEDIYFCPHHDLVESCICRKPDTLMFEKAAARHQINIAESFYFGDQERDKIAGEKAGLKTIKTEPNENLCNYLELI
jgi:D-glycero-D-manno-heptose 1,7-bisphosphate phosphatase